MCTRILYIRQHALQLLHTAHELRPIQSRKKPISSCMQKYDTMEEISVLIILILKRINSSSPLGIPLMPLERLAKWKGTLYLISKVETLFSQLDKTGIKKK